MMDSKFVIGDVYFMLRFLDRDFKYPKITSIIFIGKNIEDARNIDDRWFFQDIKSYLFNGVYDGSGKDIDINSNVTSDGEVFEFPEEQLVDILSTQELVSELSKL